MLDQATINIVLILSIIILFILHFLSGRSVTEHLTSQTDASNEAIQNIASVYNTGTLVVDNLQVKNGLQVGNNLQVGNTLQVDNSLQVNGKSTLGQWTIYNDRIGIPGRGDMNLAGDQWIRFFDYGTSNYTTNGGYASQNMWCNNSDVSGNMNVKGNIAMSGGNVLTDNMAIGVQSSRGGYLLDNGGWSGCTPAQQDKWEVMRITKFPFPPKPLVTTGNIC